MTLYRLLSVCVCVCVYERERERERERAEGCWLLTQNFIAIHVECMVPEKTVSLMDEY